MLHHNFRKADSVLDLLQRELRVGFKHTLEVTVVLDAVKNHIDWNSSALDRGIAAHETSTDGYRGNLFCGNSKGLPH